MPAPPMLPDKRVRGAVHGARDVVDRGSTQVLRHAPIGRPFVKAPPSYFRDGLHTGLQGCSAHCCSAGSILKAYPPSSECPTPEHLSFTSNSTTFVDLSYCPVFGLDGVVVEPSHGNLTGVDPVTGNVTSQFSYLNNGDGALSDNFTVHDDSNGTVAFLVKVASARVLVSPATLPVATVAKGYS